MHRTSPAIQDLARRLLAVEAASGSALDDQPHAHEAARVTERLRIALTKFAGPSGFEALLSRALALAKSDVPALQAVNMKPNGSLEGFAERTVGDGGIALIAHLLGLLVTFIGEPITLNLLADAWPDESLDG